MFLRLFTFVTALWLGTGLALAQELPAPKTPYVNDYIGLLSEAEAKTLAESLANLRREHDIEMTVVLMGSRAAYGSDASLEAFATRLFNTWGIGAAARNDGILFLVLKNDRKTRIELGKAYGNGWDGTAARILDRDVLPFFKQEDYATGILRGTGEIIDEIALAHRDGRPPPAPKRDWVGILFGAFFAGIAALVLIPVLFGRRLRDAFTRRSRCPNCGARRLDVERETTRKATKGRKGEKARRIRCGNCDYRDNQLWAYSAASSSSSSSSSSFGGGSSGGGGASGSW